MKRVFILKKKSPSDPVNDVDPNKTYSENMTASLSSSTKNFNSSCNLQLNLNETVTLNASRDLNFSSFYVIIISSSPFSQIHYSTAVFQGINSYTHYNHLYYRCCCFDHCSVNYSHSQSNEYVLLPTISTFITPMTTDPSWWFDNDANDLYDVYNGVLMNGATYSSRTYFGYCANLLLNSSFNQYVTVSSSFLNLSYTSFTVEPWVFVRTFAGDNGIFSQCQCASCQDQCLHLIIRNARMYMGFTLDDLVGINTMPTNAWTHVVHVYDYSSRTQSIYLQGVLDNWKTSAGPYQGQDGSIVIGSSHLSSSSFNGFIDNMKVTTRAKSSREMVDAANTVVYFSFDVND